jgi:hypothetical protein
MEPDAASGIFDLVPLLIGAALGIAFLAVYGGSVAWVVGDAQKRGYSGIAAILCWPFGPLIWLSVRPRTRLVERPVHDYATAAAALEAASKLDMLGDWDEAIALYQYVAGRWPEYEVYVKECIKLIDGKKGGH